MSKVQGPKLNNLKGIFEEYGDGIPERCVTELTFYLLY